MPEKWQRLADAINAKNQPKRRIKPERSLRPWKPEEVPVGAILIPGNNSQHAKMLIVETDRTGFYRTIFGKIEFLSYYNALQGGFLHSIDFGKTWHPCGVMES